jgi:hypothetical protein
VHHNEIFNDLALNELRKKYIVGNRDHFVLQFDEDLSLSEGQESSSGELSDDDDFTGGTKLRENLPDNASGEESSEKDDVPKITKRKKPSQGKYNKKKTVHRKGKSRIMRSMQ